MRALVMSIAALTVAGFATPSHAAPGDILVKVRGSYAPRPGSSAATVNVGDTVATAKPRAGIGFEAGLTYFITNHLAAEVGFGGTSYDLKDSAGRTLTSAGLITPAATLQYHLMPNSKFFRPYVGIGASYANFYGEKAGEILTDRIILPPITYAASIKGALAPVAQLGADVSINDKFYINVDAKYLGCNTKLAIEQGGARQTVPHKMRSLIVGVGAGFRF